jgi:hypothetical protein
MTGPEDMARFLLGDLATDIRDQYIVPEMTPEEVAADKAQAEKEMQERMEKLRREHPGIVEAVEKAYEEHRQRKS